MKMLFAESWQSLGSRQMMKQPRSFEIGHHWVRALMRKLNLEVKRKKRFVLTTDSKHKQPVADNLLNREFNPEAKNQVWTTDITYIWALQGWIYLAVVIDLYSRRVVVWSLDKQMSTALVTRVLTIVRSSPVGLIHEVVSTQVESINSDYNSMFNESQG